MNLLEKFRKILKKDEKDEVIRAAFKNKYAAFQELLTESNTVLEMMADMEEEKFSAFRELLSENNAVLGLIADMEEKFFGEFLFDRHYINQAVATIRDRVKKVVDNLNAVSRNKYALLYQRLDDITTQIDDLLARRKKEVPITSLTLPLEEISGEMADCVGFDNASLGEIRNRVSLPTLPGFAVSGFAFRQFMEHNRLQEKIHEKITVSTIDGMDALIRLTKEIQEEVLRAEYPPELEKQILAAYAKLCDAYGPNIPVFVRSGLLQEEREFSLADQYAAAVNIPSESLLEKYKEAIARLFNQRVIFHYKTRGFDGDELVLSVGVLAMIDAKAGGVLYSQDPQDPALNRIVIGAYREAGQHSAYAGTVGITYSVSRAPEMEITERIIQEHDRGDGGESERRYSESVASDDVTAGNPCLTGHEVKRLAQYALTLETYFKSPQQAEWVLGHDQTPYIVRSGPLRIGSKEALSIPTRIPGYPILIDKGVIAAKGIGFGQAYVVKADEDLENFPEGAVLVARQPSTKMVTVMPKARAIITDIGSATGHVAALARKFQLPALFDTERATDIIKSGQDITVDAFNGNIYEGRVPELVVFSEKRSEVVRETHLFKTLEKVLRLITPLNLVDPEDERFKPEFCETLHDIMHFCHEKATGEMFAMTDTPSRQLCEMSRFYAGIPIDIYLLDLGGGIEGTPKLSKPEDIHSLPFNAMLRGLVSMQWPEPRAFDVTGFLGAIAHTATIPEDELFQTGDKSFAFIALNYMNFAIRLGYHLSTVEAFCGDNLNDNYVRFFFKGGGAVLERRMRRVRLITEILRRMGFQVKISEDIIRAVLKEYKKADVEKKLEVLGKLTVYTKQQDMVMYNDAITNTYIQEFCDKYV